MVRRHISMPHRIACITDMPAGIDRDIKIIKPPRDFEDVRIPTWGSHMPQCLRRIALFRPEAARIFGKRFVSMDLDCIISDSLDPLFDRQDDFVMYRGTTRNRPYNGSMVMMTAGARPKVYTDFTAEGAVRAGQQYLGSDQAWISHILGGGEKVWDASDGVHAWESQWNVGEPRITFFLMKDKPWDFVAAADPFAVKHYRGDIKGRCLVLGYHRTVWKDAERALARGKYDAVIASPEAAAHWPRPVDMIAHSDDQALTFANMMGYRPNKIVFCGKQPEREVA